MNRVPVSALVLTRNEERHIARCLESLGWADEVIVVDAESTDRTAELATKAGARVITRRWPGFRDQRTFALAEARNDWVLVVDADEACSPELATRIRDLMTAAGGPPHRAYQVRRIEYFLGKPIEYGIWNPSYQDRFFHRAGVKYVNEIHEYPIFPAPPQRIHEPLHHSPLFEPEKFLEKMNKYTSIEARDRVKQGQRTNWFRMVFAFPAMFLKNYFYYGAYKDGMHGFAISILEGISRAVRHVKMWQYQTRTDEREQG
ncbi:MAG TPA: glycosyltransferase family 2 protein [Bdellovibrionota bacterium]|nr:glycosyltransferase family 2 protein [Bdellovibrionota bacterium]